MNWQRHEQIQWRNDLPAQALLGSNVPCAHNTRHSRVRPKLAAGLTSNPNGCVLTELSSPSHTAYLAGAACALHLDESEYLPCRHL